jgi:hypothetical protein
MADASQDLYINDNGFVFDYKTGLMCRFNETGLFIFKKLLKGTPLPEITQEFESKYGINHSIAEPDIHEFLQQLADLNLLVFKSMDSND